MRVLKFGGTSIGDAESICRVCRIIDSRSEEPVVLVFSAIGDTTDRLENIGALTADRCGETSLKKVAELREQHLGLLDAVCGDHDRRVEVHRQLEEVFDDLERLTRAVAVLGELSPRVQARLLGFGELLSTCLLVAALKTSNVSAVGVDARDLIVARGDPLDGEPLKELTTERCRAVLTPLLESHRVPVTQGFIARSLDGNDATLGRGGSDCTAALIGAALESDAVEIWTDVDGIMTADPQLVPDARCVPVMSLKEAAALAFFGARVLHPGTLAPAIDRGIPVQVRNTWWPDRPGTQIEPRSTVNGGRVRSIASRGGITLINLSFEGGATVHEQFERTFRIFDRHRVSPEVVVTSEASIAVGCRSAPSDLTDELARYGAVSLTPGQAVVGLVGDRLAECPGIICRMFEALRDFRISLVSIGGSESTLGLLVDEAEAPRLVRLLHRRLFEKPARSSTGSDELHAVACSSS